MTESETKPPQSKAPTTFNWEVRLLLMFAVSFTIGLYLTARRLEWGVGYVYLGYMAFGQLLGTACALKWSPGLIATRSQIRPGTERWDFVFLAFVVTACIVIATSVIQERRQSSVKVVPDTTWLAAALFLHVPAYYILMACSLLNPFFEVSVRIQKERGHHVVDTGPYGIVRHPGYVGFILLVIDTPLLLASRSPVVWACVVGLVVAFVIRTYFEDQTLQQKLHGYLAYTQRVKYRLIPGIW